MFTSITYHKSQEDLIKSLKMDEKYLILAAEKSDFDYSTLPKEFFFYGGVFPYIIYEEEYSKEGFILAKLNKYVDVKCITKMQYANLTNVCKNDAHSLFVIVDGLSSYIVSFLEKLFEITPANAKMLGGGAGKLTLMQEPVIFTNEDIFKDAALIFSSTHNIGVGVNHGWKKLYGPLIATNTDKNILKEINYEDAFDIYKKIVENDSGKKLSKENFFDIAKSYPLGVTKYNSEVVVRDPITTDEKELILVGEMDENSVVTILKGENDNLINAAGLAAKDAQMWAKENNSCLVVDCVSRVLFLEENFTKELSSIKSNTNSSLKQWGMLTLGEIANANEGNIEFYNKTCVVGIF